MLEKTIVTIFVFGALLASCRSSTSTADANDCGTCVFACPDGLGSLLGDSVVDAMLNVKSISLYKLEPFLYDDSAHIDAGKIGGYKVESKLGKLRKPLYDAFLFVVSDSSLFIKCNARVKQPFSPYIAVGFGKGKHAVHYLFSFGTEEVCVLYGGETVGTFRITDMRQVLRWCRLAMPEDEYLKTIQKKFI